MMDLEHILDQAFAAAMPGSKWAAPVQEIAAPDPHVPQSHPQLPGSWSKARATPIASQAWRAQVKMKLISGLGVEDISIWLDCHPSHIRAEVTRLRAAGDFRKWWGK